MSNAPTTAAARMMGEAGSACDENLTDDEYDMAARVLDALGSHAGSDYSPSQIARLVGGYVDTRDVHGVLPALVADGHVSTTERGAWSRYRFIWG